jgi:hypothetical protein
LRWCGVRVRALQWVPGAERAAPLWLAIVDTRRLRGSLAAARQARPPLELVF